MHKSADPHTHTRAGRSTQNERQRQRKNFENEIVDKCAKEEAEDGEEEQEKDTTTDLCALQ